MNLRAGINKGLHSLGQPKDLLRWAAGILFIVGAFTVGLINSVSANWGLLGTYYQGPNFEKKIKSVVNKAIYFTSKDDMTDGLPSERFSARWTGFIMIPKDGDYRFMVTVDDGIRLFIDGVAVIESWRGQPPADYSGNIKLNKGSHTIKIDYFQDTMGVTLKLFWEKEKGKREFISSRFFRPDERCL